MYVLPCQRSFGISPHGHLLHYMTTWLSVEYVCVCFSGRKIHNFFGSIISFLKRSGFTSVGTSKLYTKASSWPKIIYILKINAKPVMLFENLVKNLDPLYLNVKYLSEKKNSSFYPDVWSHIHWVQELDSNVNSHICMLDAGLWIFPEPKCIHLCSAPWKPTSGTCHSRKGEDAVNNPKHQVHG